MVPTPATRDGRREGSMPRIHRRELLKGSAAAAIGAALGETAVEAASAQAPAGDRAPVCLTPGG
ncbi:MAG: twin-arginine translocation signal domain-containing protein, partial [Micromonosporaceae bacterium]|nr:twin-arginine translocation signal domain-containing protein [Micromonosporaceae bacterium]